MRDLRLTLATDLTAAAGAAEEGAQDVAAQIVEADRLELALFAEDADRRLRRLATGPVAVPDRAAPASPRWRRRLAIALPVVPMVGALAVSAAAAAGVLPMPGKSTDHVDSLSAPVSADNTASSTFRAFADVVGSDPSASQVIAAAGRLHDQLAKLLASSSTNPDSAAQLVQLLRMEQSLLLTQQPPGADVVLHATRKLAKKLVDVVNAMTEPTTAPNVIPTFDYDQNDSDNNSSTKSSPSPSPTKSSPKPTHSASSSPTPEPSSSSYDPPPLPAFP
jgi:hypothetical protein